MSDTSEAPIYSGRPMSVTDLINHETAIDEIPSGAKIVTIDEARNGLKEAARCLAELQSISDISGDLTEELDIILESYDSKHDHVTELADYLATMIQSWHGVVKRLQSTGARMACLELGRLEWYGVVDEKVVQYSWCSGEEDIEWYHELNSSFLSRKPLIEA
ncbi:MAG: DUF2203 family protein [Euryarchaeota archaeon]|nr:DUF2203 family protein [Euryarchaeota archaeon]